MTPLTYFALRYKIIELDLKKRAEPSNLRKFRKQTGYLGAEP